MDPVTLIVTALAAGASSGAIEGLQDDASDAAKRAYARLRNLATKRIASQPDGEQTLNRHHNSPQTWESALARQLTEADASGDTDLIAAARALLGLLGQPSPRQGKYNVTISDATGIQTGDGNIQINKF